MLTALRTHASEHRRLAPVLALARQLDVATHSDPAALFEAGAAGFQIWCTPQNNPGGDWTRLPMNAGAFAQPCEYVASLQWGWEDLADGPAVTHLVLSTDAYALCDHYHPALIRNRPDDLAWATTKIRQLFERAGVSCPPLTVAP